MCSLFGLIDYKNTLTTREKNRILAVLSRECEVRGTDATGIAYNYNGGLQIYKRPLPARKLQLRVPNGVNVVMGHTRMTTQGHARFNQNNHPFPSKSFALAHNGVLWNDRELRVTENIPKTCIQTDSYVAVQLLEKERALNFQSIKTMAEKVQGSFVFTVLDKQDNLYFVRGDNPLSIFCYDGFILYASTAEILRKTERRLGLRHEGTIETAEGDILKIDRHGDCSFGGFTPRHTVRHWWRYYPWLEPEVTVDDTLFDAAKAFGVTEDEVQALIDYGCDRFEIEELLYDVPLLRQMVEEIRCY